MKINQDNIPSIKSQMPAMLMLLFGTAAMGSGLYSWASGRADDMKTSFYANKPDQTGWPTCTGQQVEWASKCVTASLEVK